MAASEAVPPTPANAHAALQGAPSRPTRQHAALQTQLRHCWCHAAKTAGWVVTSGAVPLHPTLDHPGRQCDYRQNEHLLAGAGAMLRRR